LPYNQLCSESTQAMLAKCLRNRLHFAVYNNKAKVSCCKMSVGIAISSKKLDSGGNHSGFKTTTIISPLIHTFIHKITKAAHNTMT